MAKDKRKAVEEVLGSPAFIENTNHASKVRAKLLAVSVVAIFSLIFDVQISNQSSFLGVKFEGLEHEHFLYAFTVIVAYLLLQYLIASYETFHLWRLRLTGTKTAFKTTATLGSKDADYPDNPTQSTLYNWWLAQTKMLKKLQDDIETVKESSAWIQRNKDRFTDSRNIEDKVMIENIDIISNKVREMRFKFDGLNNVYSSERIVVSLKRFDNWFFNFLKVQNFRWFVFDFLVPVALAGISLYMLGEHIFILLEAN